MKELSRHIPRHDHEKPLLNVGSLPEYMMAYRFLYFIQKRWKVIFQICRSFVALSTGRGSIFYHYLNVFENIFEVHHHKH